MQTTGGRGMEDNSLFTLLYTQMIYLILDYVKIISYDMEKGD